MLKWPPCFGGVLTQLHYKLDYLLPYNTDIDILIIKFMIQTSAKTIILKNVMGSDLISTDGDRVLNKHLHSCSLCVVVIAIDD